jgi:undecaprenyl phosphate N,N'-diacetylbacillosamine 1-phosphate transferase
MYFDYTSIKRILDLFASLVAFILLFPVFVVIIVWLYFANKGAGVFFTQLRPGKNKKIFKVFKFKTMSDKKDLYGILLPDHKRITKIGQFIRSASLDELPQLINVLKGDMSLIGPRPLLVQYLPLYNEQQSRRHEVRPGISGWAQVNGRNTIGWKQKFEYDVWYVDHISFLLDLKILVLTVKKIFLREGISSETYETMEVFTGDEKQWR